MYVAVRARSMYLHYNHGHQPPGNSTLLRVWVPKTYTHTRARSKQAAASQPATHTHAAHSINIVEFFDGGGLVTIIIMQVHAVCTNSYVPAICSTGPAAHRSNVQLCDLVPCAPAHVGALLLMGTRRAGGSMAQVFYLAQLAQLSQLIRKY